MSRDWTVLHLRAHQCIACTAPRTRTRTHVRRNMQTTVKYGPGRRLWSAHASHNKMCYYAPMPLMFEWGEGEAVTEVLPKLASGEDIQQSAENLLPHMQQTFLYYDPTVCDFKSHETDPSFLLQCTQNLGTNGCMHSWCVPRPLSLVLCANETTLSCVGRGRGTRPTRPYSFLLWWMCLWHATSYWGLVHETIVICVWKYVEHCICSCTPDYLMGLVFAGSTESVWGGLLWGSGGCGWRTG